VPSVSTPDICGQAQQSAFTVIQDLKSDRRSVVLYDSAPLTSSELQDYAGIRYANDVANDTQKAATAADVGALMEADGAIQFYSYFSIYEDIAQLVEAVMMEYHYDSVVNIGSTIKPADPDQFTCAELLVEWGQRNRRADSLVNNRSYTATELIVGVSDELAAYLNANTSSTEPMDIGVNWCDNHTITAGTAIVETEELLAIRVALESSSSSLSASELSQIIDDALHEADATISLHQHIRQINEHFAREQKIQLIEQMWRVAYADGDLDKYEDYTIRKLSELLYLKHRDFMQAKLAVLDN